LRRGRPSAGPKKKTSLDFSPDEKAAIRFLQANREKQARPALMRDLIVEGLNLLLAQEGLDLIPQREASQPAVVVRIK
jgi:hypothetical protein